MSTSMRKWRAEASGLRLSAGDAAVAKGMLRRGDRQHDVAAWFGINPGRIAEIACGRTFAWVDAAGEDGLPPPGPYSSGKHATAISVALAEARGALAKLEEIVARRTG
jgi:hypothetical protein